MTPFFVTCPYKRKAGEHHDNIQYNEPILILESHQISLVGDFSRLKVDEKNASMIADALKRHGLEMKGYIAEDETGKYISFITEKTAILMRKEEISVIGKCTLEDLYDERSKTAFSNELTEILGIIVKLTGEKGYIFGYHIESVMVGTDESNDY